MSIHVRYILFGLDGWMDRWTLCVQYGRIDRQTNVMDGS